MKTGSELYGNFHDQKGVVEKKVPNAALMSESHKVQESASPEVK